VIINIPYTLAQLRGFTKTQLITGISNYLTNNMTKRQILIWLMDNLNTVADASIRVKRADGQITSVTDVDRDMETGLMTGGRVVTFTYYPTGEVDTITISTRDAANVEIAKKVIKHYTDGKQPEVL
jgi:hypothetical protein